MWRASDPVSSENTTRQANVNIHIKSLYAQQNHHYHMNHWLKVILIRIETSPLSSQISLMIVNVTIQQLLPQDILDCRSSASKLLKHQNVKSPNLDNH